MEKGVPIFTLAQKTIKGWFPISKGGKNAIIPFVGTYEEEFLYYVEYHPAVTHIERVDIGQDFVERYNLHKSVIAPLAIPYEWDNKAHNYYPDFLLTLRTGKTIIVEVGKKEDKERDRALSKSFAAINYCTNRGWEYWLIQSNNIISQKKKANFILLKSFDKPMYRNPVIQEKIIEFIHSNRNIISIADLVNNLSNIFPEKEIEMAAYELVNRAAKEGRLVFDFDRDEINKNSILEILDEKYSPIIPEEKNISYEKIFEIYKQVDIESQYSCEDENVTFSSFDVEQFPDDKKQVFLNKRAAVLEVLSGNRKEPITKIASRYNIKRSTLYHLVENYIKHVEKAFIPYYEYHGQETYIVEEVKAIIKKISAKRRDWTAMQIYESDDLKKAIIALSKQTNELIKLPSYYQIYRYLDKINKDDSVFPLTPHERSKKGKISTLGDWVKSISSCMDHVQVDAHWLDIKIVTEDNLNVAGKLWAIVAIDVKTAMILGYSLSLKDPMEEDYMMALKSCIEPKDSIVNRYSCESSWPCSGIPRRILSDNGKIFISKRTTDVLVKRFGIVEEIAPPYAPDVKGSIEALFTWVVKRLTSRLPGYTKNRDSKDIDKEVLQTGITFEDFERLFVKAIVDGYNQEWDNLRGHTRFNLWISEEMDKGTLIPKWLGGRDELKLLLMKEEQSRKVDRHGISFLGRYYQNKTMTIAIINQRVNIRYDKRDISVIYIYLEDGRYYCEAYCQDLMGRRLSIWEDHILKHDINMQKKFYNHKARANTNQIISEVKGKKTSRLKEKEARFIEQSNQYDKQDIHISKVNETISNVRTRYNNEKPLDIIPIDFSEVNIKKPKIRRI